MKKLITKKGSCPIKDTSLIYRILKISLFLILFLPLSLAARDDNSMGKKLKEKSKSNLTYVEQILKVTGRLTDANGNPLPGVTILEKKTTNGTLSDQNGNFSISVSSGNSILVFSYIGYTAQEISVGSQNVINVILKESLSTLDEVVVIGYGTSKKSDLVGAVSSVKSTDLQKATSSSVAQMLQGKAAGLVINEESAQPGGGFSFNIRGLASTGLGNDPLVIVDGFAISNDNVNPVSDPIFSSGSQNTSISSINPNDIESIEVLKDASATAIYGARAGHGVILITTKRGKIGKTQVTFSSSLTSQVLYRRPNVLNAKDYMIQGNLAKFENYMSDNNIFPYGTKLFSEISAPYVPYFSQTEIDNAKTTDWYGLVTRKGVIQQDNLSVEGGNETTKFMFSANYYKNDGVVKNNSFKRLTTRLNLDNKFGKYTTGGISLMLSQLENHNIQIITGDYTSEWGIIGDALAFAPNLPVKQPDGTYTINPAYPGMANPVSFLDNTNITTTSRVLGNSYLMVEPVKGLVIKGTLGLDYQLGQGESYLPTTFLNGAQVGGRADRSSQNTFSWQYDVTINYNKKFADAHNVNLLLGYSQQEFKDDYFSAGNQNFITDGFLYNNLGLGASVRPDVSSSADSHAIAGYFARVTYDYKGKYYFTGTVRRDGSSDFATNYQWGVFPSLAAGWKISEEPFIKSIDWLSLLKIRGSWGQTGNAGLGGRANAYYGSSGQYFFGNSLNLGVALIQLANPNLKWETTTEVNGGLDIGLFKNRVTLTVDYFHRVISDLMSSNTLPAYLERSSVAANIGKTQSDGAEITLNTVNFDKPDFTWNSAFTFSYYYDRWKERAATWVPHAWESVDDPIRTNSGYLYDGYIKFGDNVPWIWTPYPGSPKALDIDGFKRDAQGNIVYDALGRGIHTGKPDGKLDDADKRIWYVDKPFFVGFTNTFKYKMFDLTVYTYGKLNVIGHDPTAFFNRTAIYQESHNELEAVKNVWAHDNLNGSPWENPPNAISNQYQQIGLQDMSFLRIKDITFGITLPKSVLPKAITSFRAYFTGSNLIVFTKYIGLDPETDSERAAYPNPRSYSVGITAIF